MTQSKTQSQETHLSQPKTETSHPPQKPDPFYCGKNQRHLKKVIADLNAHRRLSRHELAEE